MSPTNIVTAPKEITKYKQKIEKRLKALRRFESLDAFTSIRIVSPFIPSASHRMSAWFMSALNEWVFVWRVHYASKRMHGTAAAARRRTIDDSHFRLLSVRSSFIWTAIPTTIPLARVRCVCVHWKCSSSLTYYAAMEWMSFGRDDDEWSFCPKQERERENWYQWTHTREPNAPCIREPRSKWRRAKR